MRLIITTTSGYRVIASGNARLKSWDSEKGKYVARKASSLKKGDFYRFPLSDDRTVRWWNYELPPSPRTDFRAKVYGLPDKMNSLVAEFFGLMVADGTIYQSGFRLTKFHEDVVDRFEGLCIALFSVKTKRFMHGNAFACEVNSTYIRTWLESVGGLAAKRKHVPVAVLRSSEESIQSAFLRGLFEDGTVNIKKGRLDHAGLTTAYEDMARTVQLMLLRLGVISSVIETVSHGNHHWRVSIYGYNATLFADRIGFISAVKNAQLRTPAGPENRYLIPVGGSGVGDVEGKPWVRRNALKRGYVSRDAARQLGLTDALKFHHERIESIVADKPKESDS